MWAWWSINWSLIQLKTNSLIWVSWQTHSGVPTFGPFIVIAKSAWSISMDSLFLRSCRSKRGWVGEHLRCRWLQGILLCWLCWGDQMLQHLHPWAVSVSVELQGSQWKCQRLQHEKKAILFDTLFSAFCQQFSWLCLTDWQTWFQVELSSKGPSALVNFPTTTAAPLEAMVLSF